MEAMVGSVVEEEDRLFVPKSLGLLGKP